MRIARVILLIALSLMFIGGLFAVYDSRTHITGVGASNGRHDVGVEYWQGWFVVFHASETLIAAKPSTWVYRDPPEQGAGSIRQPVIDPDVTGTHNLWVVSWHDNTVQVPALRLHVDHAVRIRLWVVCLLVGVALAALGVFIVIRRRKIAEGLEPDRTG